MTMMKQTRGFRIVLMSLMALVIGSAAAFPQADDMATEDFDPIEIAATALGITVDELDAFIDEGKSIAQVARDLSIAPSAVVDALVQADAAEIDVALAAGEIDEAEAADWRDLGYVFAVELVYMPVDELFWDDYEHLEAMDDSIWEDEDFESYGDFDDYDEWGVEDAFDEMMYSVLPFGMAIESQRAMAYSLLDSDVEPEAVVDAVLDAEVSLLDQILDVVMGIFDFDEWLFDDDELFEDELMEIVADELALDEDDLWDALDEGKTLADLAQAAGKDPQALLDAVMAEEDAFIAELVADDEMTAEEAEEWRTESLEYYTELIFEPWF